jgi:CheY-like chemotaxis protein
MATILVVDDEPGLRAVLSGILKSQGYNVLTAENGTIALSTVKQSNPDAMFLDIRLPDMDGLQILEEVKKTNPGIPVIMCSGFSDVESAVQTVKMGAFDYISKPFKRDEVIKAAAKALQARSTTPGQGPATVLPKEGITPAQPGVSKSAKKSGLSIPIIAGIAAAVVLLVFIGLVMKGSSGGKGTAYPIIYANPVALTWDGKSLWACDWIAQSVYKHTIDDKLTIASTYQIPNIHFSGLAFDGQYLWTSDSWTRQINKHNMDASLSLVVSYPAISPEPAGLFWDGTNLWCCDTKEQKIYKLAVSVNGLLIVKDYPNPCRIAAGLFIDKDSLYVADSETNKIHKFTISDMSSAGVYTLPEYEEPGEKIAGITFDGKNIWTCTMTTQKVYKNSKSDLKKVK